MPISNITHNKRLPDIYADLFALANHLKEAKSLGPIETLRSHLMTLLDRANREAKWLDLPADTLDSARYAVVAFLDEMILCSPCPDREWWSAHKLQLELFNEDAAGAGFFQRLETIQKTHPVNKDLLEVYYLCLVLGFEGRYKIHRRDQLKTMIEDVARQLGHHETGTLSPHGQRPNELIAEVGAGLPSWVVITVTAAILFFSYISLSFIIGHRADSAIDEMGKGVSPSHRERGATPIPSQGQRALQGSHPSPDESED
jgi:type VI secretion system protein ImpK